MADNRYDALLVVSFGGPEGKDDVLPFLENVLRGRNIPHSRMLEVADHYHDFEGVSPLNAQNRALIAALEEELKSHRIELPIYFGNRNWHPLLPATVEQMKSDGVQRSLAFFTSAYSSYSSCRQYRENLVAARRQVGDGAPEIHKLRGFFNHPGFVDANSTLLGEALARLPADPEDIPVLFSAHSIPLAMARGSDYEAQLRETAALISDRSGTPLWELVFQSRSGPPHQPWLEPDVVARIEALAAAGHRQVVVAPIGFLSDHIEVIYDLDKEAGAACRRLGIEMSRASTVGTHPRFVSMIRELIQERLDPSLPRLATGTEGPLPDSCPADCCRPLP